MINVDIEIKNIKLIYICPECEHEFLEFIWTNCFCPNCQVQLETDYIEDECAGLLGVCNTVLIKKS